MSIASMEGLRALDVGTTVNVGRTPWTVIEGNRLHNGTVNLDMDYFEGQIRQGSLTLGERYESGQFWQQPGGYCFYLHYVGLSDWTDNPQQTIVYAYWTQHGDFAGFQTSMVTDGTDLGTLTTTLPDWFIANRALVSSGLGQYIGNLRNQYSARNAASVRDLSPQVEALQRQLTSAQSAAARLTEALSEWAKQEDDIDSDLTDIFDEHDIEWRGREEIDVEVTISGRTEIDLESRFGNSWVEELIQESREADWSSSSESCIELSWDHATTFTIEVDAETCGCELIDRNRVEEYLNDNSFEWSSFDFECDCPNH